MRRARKTDGNHARLRTLFRDLGCAVEDLSDVGRGIPDLLVRLPHRGRVLLVEVKDGSLPASRRRLTDSEKAMQARWGDAYVVVEDEDDVRYVVGQRFRETTT